MYDSAGHYYSTYELRHHGILGQKWGVRRFQNKDGTLTSAGKKRIQKVNEFAYKPPKGDKWSERDYAQLQKYVNDMETVYNKLSHKEKFYVSSRRNDDEYSTLDGYKRKLESKSKYEHAPLKGSKIIYNSSGDPIGYFDAHKDYANEIKFDIAIVPEERGKGYYRQLCAQIPKIVKQHPEVNYFEWPVHKNNTASIAIAEKLNGFERTSGMKGSFICYTLKKDRKGFKA